MSSTNKTTNYDLSQFVGSDKPAWLSDYNQDMSKIDAAIKSTDDTAVAASGASSAANTAIGSLDSLTTTDKTSTVAAINEVNTSASTAQNSANAANVKAENNADAIANIVKTLNINNYTGYSSADLGAIVNATTPAAQQTFTIARNDDGSLFKVYGNIIVTPNTSGTAVIITLNNTGISTANPYTINGCGIAYRANNNQLQLQPVTINVNNNSMQIQFTPNASATTFVVRLWACLYFNGDFGDIVPSA